MRSEMQMHDSPRRPLREARDSVGYVRTGFDLADILAEEYTFCVFIVKETLWILLWHT